MLKLIHYPLCPFSRSIRLALAECGIDVQLEEEHPWEWNTELLEINPSGSLPILMIQDGPTLCGAYAISEYLSDTGAGERISGRNFSLFPGNSPERAEVRRVVDWFHNKFDREVSVNIIEEKVHKRFMSGDESGPNMDVLRAGYENLNHHLSYISYLAKERTWLGGDEFSFADFAAAGHLSCIDYLGDIPWDEFPPAKTWYVRVKSRPAFRVILGDRIPGLKPPDYYTDLDF